MPIQLSRLIKLRPFLYHLTDQTNLVVMCETAQIHPASTILREAGQLGFTRVRRVTHHRARFGEHEIVLRDQAPLHSGHIAFAEGFGMSDLLESLNDRVFFWPGTDAGPIDYGMRHFERYRAEQPAVLRIRFESLLAANPHAEPLLCGYNSGSPRSVSGVKSPRGPDTFRCAANFDGPPGAVVEVTFASSLHIPVDAEYGLQPTGPWRRLL
jgi:hypothetical protein